MKNIIHRPVISWVLLVAIFAVTGGLAVLSSDNLRYADERDYHLIALNIIKGNGYVKANMQPEGIRAPGFTYTVSLIYYIWDRPIAVKLFNALALTLSIIFTYLLVRDYFPYLSLSVPLLVLSYPVFMYTATTLLPQILGTLFLSLTIFLLVRYMASVCGLALAGMALGILILTVPTFLMFTPLLTTFVFIMNRRTFSGAIYRTAIFLVCGVLIISPWTIRNYLVFNRFVPVSTAGGLNLLLGNSENTKPNSGTNVDLSNHAAIEGMNDAESDAYYREEAFTWIKNNLYSATILYLKKTVNYFNFRNDLATVSESSLFRDMVVFFTYYPLLGLGLIRLALIRKYPLNSTEMLLYLIYFSNAFLSAIFFTRIRFRLPFDLLLVAIDSFFLGLILENRFSKQKDKQYSQILIKVNY